MKCPDEIAMDRLLGSGSWIQRLLLNWHLRRCSSCRALAHELRSSQELEALIRHARIKDVPTATPGVAPGEGPGP